MRPRLALLLIFLAAPALAEAAPAFLCPGTDPGFFEEIQENGWVGYGETWDLHTCDEGREVFAPALADRRWRAFRPGLRPPIDEADVEFYSTIFPIGAFGSIGAIFAIAFILGQVQRRRKTRYFDLACTGCELTMRSPEADTRLHSLFCPGCGAPCEIQGST